MKHDMPDVTAVRDAADLSYSDRHSKDSYLVMIYGEHLGQRFSITDRPLLIGRSPSCSIQLEDDCVSRMHCRVISNREGLVICDLNSTNGTYLNGAAVAAKPLMDGDKIKVGRSIFKFLTGDNIEHAYHEEIYRLKTTDGLTGAKNKRFFEEDLDRELCRFLRYGRPLSLLMMDIDFFKKINDDNGHLAGDRVLSQLGVLVSNNVRREDTFCRYGGEEFAVLMPEMGFKEAIEVANRLRKLIAEAHFDFEGLDLTVTVSIGVAEADAAMSHIDDYIKVADARLYKAKRNGRNRVEYE